MKKLKKLKLKKRTIDELTEKVNSRYRFKSPNDGRHYLLLIEDITDKIFNFVENSWWNKKNHQYDNLKNNFV